MKISRYVERQNNRKKKIGRYKDQRKSRQAEKRKVSQEGLQVVRKEVKQVERQKESQVGKKVGRRTLSRLKERKKNDEKDKRMMKKLKE